MADKKTREKRRLQRLNQQIKKNKIQDQRDQDFDDAELPVESELQPTEILMTRDQIEKGYDMPENMFYPGPTSFSELETLRQEQEKAELVRETSWDVSDLVRNILNHPTMQPSEKGKAIAEVGKGFDKKLSDIIAGKVVEKDLDIDVLEIGSIVAKDNRRLSLIEKSTDFIVKKFSKQEPVYALPDFKEFPIHTKSHVRQSLNDIYSKLENGEDEHARMALPVVKDAAKTFEIGYDSDSIVIEKDASGSYRAILWPTNNFMDLDGEILSDAAHREYVDWVNKNMDVSPVFISWHTPGTAREHPVDFVAYENGQMIMSLPLTVKEAASLFAMQTKIDVGMSHGTIVLERDPHDKNVITKYRMVECSDLPLERAANPYTSLTTVIKEADVDTFEYLTGMVGKERATALVAKMQENQDTLRKAGVKEKEKEGETPAAAVTVVNNAPDVKLDELVDRVTKELGMEELSVQFKQVKENAEKVPVLEALVKELLAGNEEQLAKMITPPAGKVFSWKEKSPTQSKDNILSESEQEKIKKETPEAGWLSEVTGTKPVTA